MFWPSCLRNTLQSCSRSVNTSFTESINFGRFLTKPRASPASAAPLARRDAFYSGIFDVSLVQQLDEPDPHGKFSRRQESENPVTPSNKPAISVDEASSTSSDATDSRFDSFKTIATELSMRKNEAVVWRPPRPGVGRSQSVPWNLWHTVNGGGKAADEEKGEMEEKSETGIEPRVASAYQKLFTRGTRRRAVEEHMFWSA